MSILREIKLLAVEGNVVAVAIGVLLGNALCNVTTSLMTNMIVPIFAAVWTHYFGSDALKTTFDFIGTPLVIQYGAFLKSLFDLIITALAIFFVIRYTHAIMHSFDPVIKLCQYCCGKNPIKAIRCQHCASDLIPDINQEKTHDN